MPVDLTSGGQIVAQHQLDLAPGQDSANAPIGVPSGRVVVGPAAHEIGTGTGGFGVLTPTTIFTSTNTVTPLGRTKAIWVVFTAAVTFAANTPTIRLFTHRGTVAQAATAGATTQLPLSCTYISAAVALTTAGVTSIPINTVYRFSSTFASSSVGAAANITPTPTTGFAELDRWDQWIGVEFNWIAAPGAGTVQVYLECAGL